MSPERAMRPTTPEPGFTSSKSSSKTTVPPVEVTVGPLFMVVPPGLIIEMPLLPPSDDPMASVMTRLGKCSKNWSLTEGEKRAAVEVTPKSDDRSYEPVPSSSASIRGRPMASPVIMTMLTRSCSTSRHTTCGSKRGTSTTRLPTKL